MKLNFTVIFLTSLPVIFACSTVTVPRSFITEELGRYIRENKYAKALNLSLLFIEAQRSGKLPDNNRIPWRGDSALFDHGFEGEDLTGGYYDGTTFVKFIWPMAFTTTILAWGAYTWEHVYTEAGQINEVYNAIRWATDYFMKCHVKPNVLYVQVGDLGIEEEYWGRPEDMDGRNRTAFQINATNPASDVAADVAAALAAASFVFRNVDKDYSAKCLRHAKQLYMFATDYPAALIDNFSPREKSPWEFYGYNNENEYIDELIWAAYWLYKASDELTYLINALGFYSTYYTTANLSSNFYFDKKAIFVELLMAEASVDYDHLFQLVLQKIHSNANFTAHGLEYINDEDTLPYAANKAFLYLILAKSFDPTSEKYKAYINLARNQIDYILGSQGRNYVVGYNEKSPTHPYHRASSCPNRPMPCTWENYQNSDPNPQILYGALVSGPNFHDEYNDTRDNYRQNKVALLYNAGFTSALAGLLHEDVRAWKIKTKYRILVA